MRTLEIREEFEKAVSFLAGRGLQEIPVEEIRAFTKGQNQTMIRLACFYEIWRYRNNPGYVREIMKMYPEGRSFRRFWYDLVKPFLSRVEAPEQVLKPKWGRYRSQTLSSVLSKMVLEGFARYKDINILDVGEYERPKKRPYEWDKYKTGRFDEVILFVEKVAEFPTIRPLADLLGFTCECGKGQQATSAIDSLVDYLNPRKSYMVFVLTDFDFWGFEIVDSLMERSHKLGIDAEFIRVGITPDQVPQDRINVMKFRLPLSNSRERRWAEEYAIEGVYGVELEALNPFELRAIIADAVYENCDPEALYEFLKEKALEGIAEKAAQDLSAEDQEILDLMTKIEVLERQAAELKETLLEKLRPRAQELLTENLGDLDDRPQFPRDWIRQQIVEGHRSLDHSEFTDPEGIQDGLEEMMRDEQSS